MSVAHNDVISEYNIFRWYRSGWGRYTQADPIGLRGGSNLYRYALANPIRYTDPLGLKVRICCRESFANRDHCYIEEQRDSRRRTWGLHNPNATSLLTYLTNPSPQSQLRRDDPSDTGGTCESWREDTCGDLGRCVQQQFQNYPVEPYSETALLEIGSGRNSNTFVNCVAGKCGLSAGSGVTGMAPGYNQPCPRGF